MEMLNTPQPENLSLENPSSVVDTVPMTIDRAYAGINTSETLKSNLSQSMRRRVLIMAGLPLLITALILTVVGAWRYGKSNSTTQISPRQEISNPNLDGLMFDNSLYSYTDGINKLTVNGRLIASEGILLSNELVFGGDTITDLTGVGLTVDGGVLTATLGASIEANEISNSSILFSKIARNGCGNGDIIRWSGSAWVCGTDAAGDADSDPSNELQNVFTSFFSSAGTAVTADSVSDNFTFANGAGIAITGDGATDTVTIAAVLGVSISGSEILDSTIEELDFEVTNTPTDSYVLTYDSASGGFTWVDPTTVGIAYSFDVTDGITPQTINNGNTLNLIDGSNIDVVTGAPDNLTVSLINNPTLSGILTLNGGLTIEAGDTFTFNSDVFTDLTGTGLQITSGNLQTTLGVSIQNAEVDDDLTVSAAGSVADGALSVNVSLLGSLIDLSSEITGTLAVLNGGTGSTTALGARGNLGAAASGSNADITGLTGLTAITPAAALTVGGTSQSLTLQGSATSTFTATDSGFTTTVGFVAPTASATINFPTLVAGTYSVCTTSGNCLGGGGGGADTALSNLSGVAINTSLLTGAATIDLGSNANPFRDLYLSGTTVLEGTTADGNEITLSVADPTADITYRYADATAGTYDICTSTGNCVGGGGGSAPSGADYLTLSLNGSLSAERVLTAGTNLSTVDGGANSTLTISLLNNPTLSGLLTLNGGLAVEAGDIFTFNGDAFTDLTGTGLQISSGNLQTTLGISVDLTSEIAGTLPILNGGTSATSSQGAINALSQLTTNGDLLYNDGANSTRLPRGANGDCLTSNATTLLWGTCASGGTTYFTLAGTSGPSQSINGADTVTIAAGTNITTTAGATDTVTVATVGNPVFSTSITSPIYTSTAGLAVTGGTTVTIASTGAGNDIIINGADILDVQDNATFAGMLDVTGTGTFFGSVTIGDAVTDGLSVVAAIQGTNALIFDGSSNDTNEITLTVTNPGSDFTITLPAANGTVCLTSGNCAGIGGNGDILNNGQNGQVRIGSNDANSIILESNGVDRVTIDSLGLTTFTSGLTGITTISTSSTINSQTISSSANFTGTLAVQGASITVGTASTTNGTVKLLNTTNAFGITISASAQTVGDATIAVPNTAGVGDTFCLVTLANCGSPSAANQQLSNLSGTVAVNLSLIPGANDTLDLGSDALRWRDLYLGGETIHLGASNSDEGVLSYTTGTNILSLQSTGTITLASNTSITGSNTFTTGTGNVSIQGDTTVASTKLLTVTSGLTSLTGNTTGDALVVSNSTSTGAIAIFRDNATAVLTVANGGAVTFQNQTDSTTALRILNAAGTTNALTVDTSNTRIGIGTTTPDARLDIEGVAGTELIRLSNSTTSDSSGIFSGSGSPEGVVTAQIGSLYTDTTFGKVYKKGSGDGTNTGWEEFAAGSGGNMAKMTRSSQSINTSVTTKVLLDTEEYDVGGIADPTTNNRINILKAGKYLVAAKLHWSGINQDSTTTVYIYKNGSNVSSASMSAGSGGQVYHDSTTTLNLAVGDYIEFYAVHFEASARTASGIEFTVAQLDAAGGGSPEVSARVYNSAAISIAHATTTSLTFNTERFDTSSIHSTSSNTDRLTAPTSGKYLITGNANWDLNTTGERELTIQYNSNCGSRIASSRMGTSTTGYVYQNVSTVYEMNAGDYVVLCAYQTSGGNLNVNVSSGGSPEFTMTKIDGGVNSTLQSAYNSGNTLTTTDARDIAITLADTTTDSNLTITSSASGNATFNLAGTGDFAVQDAGTQAFLVNDSGVVWVGAAGSAGTATGNGDLYVQDAAEFDGNIVVGDANTDSATFNANILASGVAGTTGTTTGTGTNTTTLVLTTDPYSVNDVVLIDNAGQDYYTRITVDPGTGSYTVSPAVTFETGRTVTRYTSQNIGATATDYTTQTNRFFQGYFTGGVVVGAASTTLSDGNLSSTGTLTLQRAGGTVQLGSVTAGLSVSSTGGLSDIDGNIAVADTVDITGSLTVSANTTNTGYISITGAQDGSGNLRFSAANPYISASSYFIAPGGAYFNSGIVYAEADIKARGGISNDGASCSGYLCLNDNTYTTGWYRSGGNAGWYSETYGGGWYMTDTQYLRAYGDKDIYTGGGVLAAAINSAGYLGYANTTAVSNTGACRGTTTVFGFYLLGHCSSLARYKDEVEDIPYDLNTIRDLRPVKYKWNIDDLSYDIGFIAEEVYAVDPIFNEYSNGVLSGVKYKQLVALAIKGIQQLDVQVQDIDTRLAVVESGEFSGDLQVAGNTELQGDLKVLGNTEVANLTVNGKIITAGATPTVVLGAYTVVGHDSTVTVEGNDTAGTLTYTAGAVNLPTYDLASGGQASVTFAVPYSATPRVNITPTTEAAGEIGYYITKTETEFILHFTSAPQPNTTYSFDYQILQ